MATSSYDHASTTILIFGVGSLVFVTIAFCMTFLGYALYCRLSRKPITWRAWRKPTAVLVIALAVTLLFALTLHIIVPALFLLAVGLFGYFFVGEHRPLVDTLADPDEAAEILQQGMSVRGYTVSPDGTDPMNIAYWED